MNSGVVIIWEFLVREGCEREFEVVYGAGGAWAFLFEKGEGYLGTELLRDASAPRRYLTVDRRASFEAFEQFRQSYAAEYDALDARCDGWTERETKVGVWTAP